MYDRRLGVQVDARLRTTHPRIFAAGDVGSRYQFTHAADALARLVLANALFMGRQKASALTIPWCTYTDPQIAYVGLTAAQAEAAVLAVTTFVQLYNRSMRWTAPSWTAIQMALQRST